MRWQRVAQAVIAIFAVGFIGVLAHTLRRESAQPNDPPAEITREEPTAVTENLGGCEQISSAEGRRLFSLKCGKHFSYADGRQRLSGGLELTLYREDRAFVVKADEGDINPKDDGVDKGVFKGNVIVTSDDLEVRAAEATYSDSEGILRIPGEVTFTRGRMRGSGVGATYDRNREVLWLLDRATIDVAADPKTGDGAVQGSAKAIGLARADHYLRLQENAKLSGNERVLTADDLMVRLSDDDERVRAMELRGNSRITGSGGGPQNMSAKDIDLAYGEDGRTLQQARLVENAVVQLAASGGGKRISGRTIDLTLGPDGSTLTSLAAQQQVQVDLPAEGQAPAKRITAATLSGTGAGGGGLESATFGGGVEYRETRAARGNAAAVDRRSRADSLVLRTQPGLGAIRTADFRGNVTFTDGPDFRAEGTHAVYDLEQDRLQLLPGEGLPGPQTRVMDGRISVAARTIDLTVATRALKADTTVRSTMLPQKGTAQNGARRLPSMFTEKDPVYVTANRLAYDGTASVATYSGNAALWQGETQLKGNTIVVDDAHGNLTVTGSVTTLYYVDEVDRKTGERTRVQTRGSSETFTYDDKRRLATYTTNARIIGAQGDLSGDKIELFMKADANELERAEAYGTVVIADDMRRAVGTHLTYTAATDVYLMTGSPVEIIERRKDGTCQRALGATARFNRTADAAHMEGIPGVIRTEQQTVPCPAR